MCSKLEYIHIYLRMKSREKKIEQETQRKKKTKFFANVEFRFYCDMIYEYGAHTHQCDEYGICFWFWFFRAVPCFIYFDERNFAFAVYCILYFDLMFVMDAFAVHCGAIVGPYNKTVHTR